MSKLTLPVKELLPVLNFAKAFLADRPIVPAYQGFLFAGDQIQASTGEAGVVCYTPWKFGDKPFALPGEQLVKVVNSLSTQGIAGITLSIAAERVTVSAEGFRGVLPQVSVENAEQFQLRPPKGKPAPVDAPFWSGIRQAMFSISPDGQRPMLRGVQWADAGSLFSTDAKRITHIYPDAKAPKCPWPPGLLLPDELLKRLGAKRTEVTGLLRDGGRLWCFAPSTSIYGLLFEEQFPGAKAAEWLGSMKPILRAKKGAWALIPEDAPILLMLDRLLTFAASGLPVVRITIKGTTLTLQAEAEPGTASGAEETLTIKREGEADEVTMRLDGRFLYEAIETIGRDIYLEPGRPVYIISPKPGKDSSDRRAEHLVLPLADA